MTSLNLPRVKIYRQLPRRRIAPGRLSRNEVRLFLDPKGEGNKLPYHVREMLKILFHYAGDARRDLHNAQQVLVFDERPGIYPVMFKDSRTGHFKVLTYERQPSGPPKLIWEELFIRKVDKEAGKDLSDWKFTDFT